MSDPVSPEAARVIAARHAGPPPEIAIVLGSGLAGLAHDVEDAVTIPYTDLPGFPVPSVAGHGGQLILGRMGRRSVAMMAGRGHFYEHGRADIMAEAIRTLKAIGCSTLILTNAAGSLREAQGPGSMVMISDHINLAIPGPLIGASGNERFVDLSAAYDPALRLRLKAAAQRLGLDLPEGVYMLFPGPNFETPAEIRAARILGADLVGMSTVPEVILARHAGLKVAAISNVTNLAAGIADHPLSHHETITMAEEGARRISALLKGLCAEEAPL